MALMELFFQEDLQLFDVGVRWKLFPNYSFISVLLSLFDIGLQTLVYHDIKDRNEVNMNLQKTKIGSLKNLFLLLYLHM